MKNVLESIFCSKTRTKMLNLFLLNPDQEFFVRELTRKLDERINSVRRELANLEMIGLLSSQTRDRKRYYSIDKSFVAYKELKELISKVNTTPQKKLVKNIGVLGKVKFACLSGFFTQSPSRVDLLIVGEVDRGKLDKFINKLEKEKGKEVNYTIMSFNEFKYRKDLDDKFIKDILDNEHIILKNLIK
jgi:hypothetical protein